MWTSVWELLAAPKDLYVTEDNQVFVLDSGNSRIIVLDADMQFLRIIQPTDPDGAALTFQEAAGLFVTSDGRIMVSDKAGMAVFVLDAEGRQIGKIEAPEANVVPKT